MTGLRIFSIAGIPVWISPWFFLLGALYVHQLGWREGLVFTLCVSVSILVHELGHALVAARYRLSPQILLHGLQLRFRLAVVGVRPSNFLMAELVRLRARNSSTCPRSTRTTMTAAGSK